MRKIAILFMILGATLFAEVKTQLSHMKILKSESGVSEKVEATTVSPGDILEYTFMIDNQEAEAIRSLNPTIPVPEGTVLIPEESEPKGFKVTLNGRDFVPYPAEVDGVPVADSEYRAIAWELNELKPNEKIEFQTQVRVNGGE